MTKIKEIKLPMEFNPGLNQYEPVLPLKKTNKKIKIEFDWKWLIFPLILLIFVIIISLIISK